MKLATGLLVAGISMICLAVPSKAQEPRSSTASPPNITEAPIGQAALLTASQRGTIAQEIISKWQTAADQRAGGGGSRWKSMITNVVATADATNVIRATTSRSLDELHAALVGGDVATSVKSEKQGSSIGNGSVAPQRLGDTTADLVYTPLPRGRCRIADSRVISSPLNGQRALFIEDRASYASQGGSGTFSNGDGSANCGINSATAAFAMSVTLQTPAGAGAFKVYKYGTPQQTGNSVWMNAGSSGASADLIVTNCLGCTADINIYSSTTVHYVIDVVGYYMRPQRTALSCYVTERNSVSIAANGTGDVYPPFCDTGYASTDLYCRGTSYYISVAVISDGQCSAWNQSTLTQTLHASRLCCSVPGR